MIERLATCGWMGDDPGILKGWIFAHGWGYRIYKDMSLAARHGFEAAPAPRFEAAPAPRFEAT